MKLTFIKTEQGQVLPVISEDVYRVKESGIVNIKGESIEGVIDCEIYSSLNNTTIMNISVYCVEGESPGIEKPEPPENRDSK